MHWQLKRPFGATSKVGESWECGACDGLVLCGAEAAKQAHDARTHGLTVIWEVQTGKGSSAYKVRYSFPSSDAMNNSRAWLYYSSINIGNGYKKRLVRRYPLTGDVAVVTREFS